MSELNDEPADPFSPEHAPKVSLVVMMRIYDVLMTLLSDSDPERAAALHKVHSNGGVMGSLPYLDLSEDEISQSDED